MIRDLFGQEDKEVKKNRLLGCPIDQPELSLGPSNAKTSKKRKLSLCPLETTGIELQAQESLPLDWEQCLDLERGRMYYVNRKTREKSMNWPEKHRKLDLELNISTPASTDETRKNTFEMDSTSNNMVAVACMKCHLLVMLCRSSPCCPNCKYVHSLVPSPQQTLFSHNINSKPLNTLSLLN
ncbi:hypothetical protein ACHQM5_028228 [Ranunculus cassubicifolius]